MFLKLNWFFIFYLFLKFLSLTGTIAAPGKLCFLCFVKGTPAAICYRKELANTRARSHHCACAFWQTTNFIPESNMSRCPQGPGAEALPVTLILELSSWWCFHTDPKLCSGSWGLPKPSEEESSQEENMSFGVGDGLGWNLFSKARCRTEPSGL